MQTLKDTVHLERPTGCILQKRHNIEPKMHNSKLSVIVY